MSKRVRKSAKTKPEPKEAPASSLAYEVDMSASAEAVYVDLYTRAQEAEGKSDPTNAVCTTFRMVEEVIERIIPRDPLNKKHALRDNFANIFRIQKGRLRICWIASSKMRRVCILFISQTMRKDGDANDPYKIFEKLLMSGDLDQHFVRLGVKKSIPPRLVQ